MTRPLFEAREEAKRALLKLISEADEPLHIRYIGDKLGVSWWPAYKLVTEVLIEEVQKRPQLSKRLPFCIWKSTKNIIVVPQRLLKE